MDIKLQIEKLEAESRLLEPSSTERNIVRQHVVDYTEGFLNSLESSKAFTKTEDNGRALLESPISEDPLDTEKIINLIKNHVDGIGLNSASGGYLGYIPGGGIYYSSLGDYLADVANKYSGIFSLGPGAVLMENMLIRWMIGLIGYPETSAGNITTGGSLSNLIAMVTARDSMNIRSKDIPNAVIYLTEQTHHSAEKAIRLIGLSECVIRKVNIDEKFRMRPDELENQIIKDREDGLKPFLIIASAGSTDVGAIDPLDSIADIASIYQLWFHIDAAYGGFFILTEEGKKKLKGIERSDSIIMDPHKTLFLPYGTGVVIVRDKLKLMASHHYYANYIQVPKMTDNDEISPADVSPELSKHFRGMRMWLPLKLHGIKPFRSCLEEKLMLAKYFYREVQKLEFEVGPEPELSVVSYRFVPQRGNADEFNRSLVEEIQKDGRIFISSTKLKGNVVLRLACVSFRTHLNTVDLLLQILREKRDKLLECFR